MKRSSRILFVALILLVAAAALWAADPPPLFYGVISDTQRPPTDPLPELQWAVGQLNAIGPDFVLWPGDLTNGGAEAEYQNVMRQAKRLTVPMYCLPGNHDTAPGEAGYRARFKQLTGQPTWQDVRVGGWHVILLDSIRFVDGKLQHDGVIGQEEMSWLKSDLAGIKPDEPIILAEHHPFTLPNDGLTNSKAVLDLFADRDLLYTVTGHMHYNRHAEDPGGIHHFITGALSFSCAPKECRLGYRLISTVGRDLWTAWIETTNPAPLEQWVAMPGPGALRTAFPISLPAPTGTGAQVAVRLRYSGDGLALRWGRRTVQRLPAATQPATAVVVLTPETSATLLAGPSEALTVRPVGKADLESVEVYRTGAKWEHYELKGE
jgi:hypothetical protein